MSTSVRITRPGCHSYKHRAFHSSPPVCLTLTLFSASVTEVQVSVGWLAALEPDTPWKQERKGKQRRFPCRNTEVAQTQWLLRLKLPSVVNSGTLPQLKLPVQWHLAASSPAHHADNLTMSLCFYVTVLWSFSTFCSVSTKIRESDVQKHGVVFVIAVCFLYLPEAVSVSFTLFRHQII